MVTGSLGRLWRPLRRVFHGSSHRETLRCGRPGSCPCSPTLVDGCPLRRSKRLRWKADRSNMIFHRVVCPKWAGNQTAHLARSGSTRRRDVRRPLEESLGKGAKHPPAARAPRETSACHPDCRSRLPAPLPRNKARAFPRFQTPCSRAK